MYVAYQDLHQAALEFDRQVLDCFTAMNDIDVAMVPLTPSEHTVISLPISKGGFGMKQSTQILHAAYIASLVPVLPTIKRVCFFLALLVCFPTDLLVVNWLPMIFLKCLACKLGFT